MFAIELQVEHFRFQRLRSRELDGFWNPRNSNTCLIYGESESRDSVSFDH